MVLPIEPALEKGMRCPDDVTTNVSSPSKSVAAEEVAKAEGGMDD